MRKRKQKGLDDDSSSDVGESVQDEAQAARAAAGKDNEEHQSNTIMQQINNFACIPMNDKIADQTIEDHKYLLELVENKCAIAFFACKNRNLSLYNALVNYLSTLEKEDKAYQNRQQEREKTSFTELKFKQIVEKYDVMSVVMYPDLKNRRDFIHDCWLIAKASENVEFKLAITSDMYFYLTRNDILELLKTHDDFMITHVLDTNCKHLCSEDISYKLIAIKHGQVDKNQMTILRMTDFISVLLMNKREDLHDIASPIVFSHNYILKFLETHARFINNDEVTKILILQRKFRLSLQFMRQSKVPFQIEFFTNAIESNSYDIAFYLLKSNEDQIFNNYQKVMDAHVASYRLDNRYLKSKLHMSKMVLPIFTFNAAKIFLEIIHVKVQETQLVGNLFSHSSNPLLNMCLLYELLENIVKKFYSLNNLCQFLMAHCIKMALGYIEEVDDENFLTAVLNESDYSGRDSLMIFVELELLEIIQAPKVEAVIKRIYNSDYDQSGDLFQMSTPYQILFGDKNQVEDVETNYRFYKKRDISQIPQSEWLFEIFKDSMSAKIKSLGFIVLIFVIWSVVYYEIVIGIVSKDKAVLLELLDLRDKLVVSNDEDQIQSLLQQSNELYHEFVDQAQLLYNAFMIVEWLCILNLSFQVHDLTSMIFTKIMGRFMVYPSIHHITNGIMTFASIMVIKWIQQDICKELYSDPNLTQDQFDMRVISNFARNMDFPFQYLFAVNVICLISRIFAMLQFNESIGPLVKIVNKMMTDFFNFSILYLLLTVMFAVIANMNFMYDLKEFSGFFESLISVIDATIGNFDLYIFEKINNPDMRLFGEILIMLVVIVFNMILLNLIIAILANTYNMFDLRSTGLYLSKILNTRGELLYDENYGAFLAALPPTNMIQIPFLPVALFLRKGHPVLIRINRFVMIIQYTIFMLIFFLFFVAVSIACIPFAWCVGIFDKFIVKNQSKATQDVICNYLFIPFGIIILSMDLIADCMYFWKNNFRTDLKKNIIILEDSKLTHYSIKEIDAYIKKMGLSYIKSVGTRYLIRHFGTRFNCVQNIQFLMFGQWVPKRGFVQGQTEWEMNLTQYKSMRTEDLEKDRINEKERLDDTAQYNKAREELQQYNEIKKILLNMTFRHREKLIVCNDIVWDVLDESRKERKILMVLKDDNVDEYIDLDMTEIDILYFKKDTELSQPIKTACESKLIFREKLAQRISITRLDYTLKDMKKVLGKAQVPDPSGFKQKLRHLKTAERVARLKRSSSLASSRWSETIISHTSGSQGISASSGVSDGASSKSEGAVNSDKDENDLDQEDDVDHSVLPELNAVFDKIKINIANQAQSRLDEMARVCMLETGGEWPSENYDEDEIDKLIDDVTKN